MSRFGRSGALAAGLMSVLVLGWAEATAAPRVGNGGGGWLCKDRMTKSHRWFSFVDLYEAETEFGLKLDLPRERDEWAIAAGKLEALEAHVPRLAALLTIGLEELRERMTILPESASLTIIDDALIRVKPHPETCPSGYLYYAQLANFTEDGRLLVAGVYWHSPEFSPAERAALLVHEVVYKTLRDRANEGNSVRTRQIVGLLFSNLPGDGISRRISEILRNPAYGEPLDDVSGGAR